MKTPNLKTITILVLYKRRQNRIMSLDKKLLQCPPTNPQPCTEQLTHIKQKLLLESLGHTDKVIKLLDQYISLKQQPITQKTHNLYERLLDAYDEMSLKDENRITGRVKQGRQYLDSFNGVKSKYRRLYHQAYEPKETLSIEAQISLLNRTLDNYHKPKAQQDKVIQLHQNRRIHNENLEPNPFGSLLIYSIVGVMKVWYWIKYNLKR